MISILICDDSQRLANSLADYLRTKTEHQILPPVYSGEACMAYIEANKEPTILILDVQMPKGMNGYDVAKLLQIHHPDIKIIVKTIFQMKSHMQFNMLFMITIISPHLMVFLSKILSTSKILPSYGSKL